MKKIFLIFVAGLLAGCAASGDFEAGDRLYSPDANMSRGQCGSADWQDLGRVEGRRGSPREIIRNYASVCEKHGESPDEELFFRGYDEGLRQRQAGG